MNTTSAINNVAVVSTEEKINFAATKIQAVYLDCKIHKKELVHKFRVKSI